MREVEDYGKKISYAEVLDGIRTGKIEKAYYQRDDERIEIRVSKQDDNRNMPVRRKDNIPFPMEFVQDDYFAEWSWVATPLYRKISQTVVLIESRDAKRFKTTAHLFSDRSIASLLDESQFKKLVMSTNPSLIAVYEVGREGLELVWKDELIKK